MTNGRTVNTNPCMPVPPAPAAPSVTLNVPAAVGVPEMRPVVAFRVNPTGKPVAE